MRVPECAHAHARLRVWKGDFWDHHLPTSKMVPGFNILGKSLEIPDSAPQSQEDLKTQGDVLFVKQRVRTHVSGKPLRLSPSSEPASLGDAAKH